MLQGVLERGTAQSIRRLAPYVGGKTGTTRQRERRLVRRLHQRRHRRGLGRLRQRRRQAPHARARPDRRQGRGADRRADHPGRLGPPRAEDRAGSALRRGRPPARRAADRPQDAATASPTASGGFHGVFPPRPAAAAWPRRSSASCRRRRPMPTAARIRGATATRSTPVGRQTSTAVPCAQCARAALRRSALAAEWRHRSPRARGGKRRTAPRLSAGSIPTISGGAGRSTDSKPMPTVADRRRALPLAAPRLLPPRRPACAASARGVPARGGRRRRGLDPSRAEAAHHRLQRSPQRPARRSRHRPDAVRGLGAGTTGCRRQLLSLYPAYAEPTVT